MRKVINRYENQTACVCDAVGDALPKLPSTDGTAHVLATFEDWKSYANYQLVDDQPIWYPALSAHTRVFPSLDWAAASMKHHLARGLPRTLKGDVHISKVLLQGMLRQYLLILLCGCIFLGTQDYFTVEHLAQGWQLLTLLAVGPVDKLRGDAFLC